MATKHACNNGRPPVFGRKTAGCPRCDELLAGAEPVVWSAQRKAEQYRRFVADLRSHNCVASRCGPVCTFGDW